MPSRSTNPAHAGPLLRSHRPGLLAVLALALMLAGGCAAKTRTGELVSEDAARTRWAAFQQRFAQPPAGKSFRITASLFYSTPKRGSRTLLTFWGDYAGPLRLDVAAALGTALSHFRDDGQLWVAYFPGERTAYTHNDAILGQRALGLPFPFTMRELALLLSGDLSPFVPPDYFAALTGPDGVGYSLDMSLASVIVLDEAGRPLRMAGPMDSPWQLAFSEYPEEGGMARRLDLDLPGEEKAVLRVKSVEAKPEAWPPVGLNLPLPVDTEVIFLDDIGLMRLEKAGDGVDPSPKERTNP